MPARLIFILLVTAVWARAERPVSYNFDIRPILSDRCFSCHGPDDKKREAELRLDTHEGMTGPMPENKKLRAFVPGKPEQSEAWRRISTHDEDDVMPPPKKRKPLTDAEKELIKKWIVQGAKWDSHWAFAPLSKPTPPKISDVKRARTEVDRFILERLDDAGLKMSQEADRPKLLRRVSLDLTGIPPTPAEVDAFVADKSADAYEKVVDRLLASPRFGERWARHWLDAARFAESHGFEQDYNRPHAYWYRDFVIRALNENMKFDQFIRWQIAGDEIAPDDPWAMAATGFLGAGQFPTQLTEAEFEQARYDELDNMAGTVSSAMLGQSLSCARCHDHKFDPITDEEYYRFAAFFTTTIRSEVELDFAPEAQAKERAAWEKDHAPLVASLESYEKKELPAKFAAWLKTRSTASVNSPWVIQDDAKYVSTGGAKFESQGDGSFLATGPSADFDKYTVTMKSELTNVTAIRVEALAHKSMVRGGPGRAPNGNFDLTNLRVVAKPTKGGAEVEVKLANPRSTFDQGKHLAVALVIDGDKSSGWAVDPQFGKDHAAAFDFEQPVAFPGGATFTVTMEFNGNNDHNIGRPRIALGTQRSPDLKDATAAAKPTLATYKPIDEGWQTLNRAVVDHAKKAPPTEKKTVMVTSEGFKPMKHHADGRGFPHFYSNTYFLTRGDVKQKGAVMQPGFLLAVTRAKDGGESFLKPPPAGARTSHRRTSLANWITDTEQGAGALLARVGVNRIWHHHFGRGIVSTPSDFGMQGAQPSHPELLEWLAADFVAHGWDAKRLHKQIVMSAAYRQDGKDNAAARAKDVDNQLLWRWPVRRLEGETIRDSVLAVSGELDTKMYGPGTLDQNMKRRSIYFLIKRSELIPALQVFDLPEPNVSVGNRVTTTVAPQALHFLNSPQIRGYAKSFAKNLTGTTSTELVTDAYRRALGRAPTKFELQKASAFLEAGGADARVDFCQAVLSLNEFAYIE